MKEKLYYVVAIPSDKTPGWCVVDDSDTIKEEGWYGFAIYETKKSAKQREEEFITEGTTVKIHEWTDKELNHYSYLMAT